MKEPLYFHMLPREIPISIKFPDGSVENTYIEKKSYNPHTYSITNKDNTFYVGYSVVHKKDQFCREFGRRVATARMTDAINRVSATDIQDGDKIHDDIKLTLDSVIKRSAEIRKISGPVDVIINCDWKGRRSYTKLKINV